MQQAQTRGHFREDGVGSKGEKQSTLCFITVKKLKVKTYFK